MRRMLGDRGYTLIDMAVAMTVIATVMGTTGPLSRKVVAQYQLNGAAQTLAADLSHAKIRAIQSNNVVSLTLESDRDYRAGDQVRRLPNLIRFDSESSQSVSFNGLGATTEGSVRSFVLTTSFGDAREIRVYAAGGSEVLKL